MIFARRTSRAASVRLIDLKGQPQGLTRYACLKGLGWVLPR